MKTILILFSLFAMASVSVDAQIVKPIKWSYAAKRISPNEATVFIKAEINEGWHIYSQTVPDGGPLKTMFTFVADGAYQTVGKVVEPTPIKEFEAYFNMDVSYFKKSVIFQQKVKLNSGKATVKGSVEFMGCSETQCLAPETVDFAITIN